MTHFEKLDTILFVLLDSQRLNLQKAPTPKRLTFDFICKTVAEVQEQWEVDYLKQRLLDDDYIKFGDYGDGEPPKITPKGIKFMQTGGYRQQDQDLQLHRENQEQNLKSLKRSKTSLWVSVIAIIIPTLISLYTLWKNSQQPTIEEMNKLKNKVDSIQKEQIELAKRKIPTVAVDTLNHTH